MWSGINNFNDGFAVSITCFSEIEIQVQMPVKPLGTESLVKYRDSIISLNLILVKVIMLC